MESDAQSDRPVGLKAALPLYEAKHWLPAFFEHAVGSLVGGAAALMIPFPAWVVAIDFVAMYLPMAWLGGTLGSGPTSSTAPTVLYP